VEAPQNVVLVSIASVLDPSLAPSGKHVVHAYTPGNEPYALWEGLERTSPEYKALKEERSQVLWRAVEKAIPDVRKRVEVQMVGTPLTQARFLRRDRGTYGGYGWVGNGAHWRVPRDDAPLEHTRGRRRRPWPGSRSSYGCITCDDASTFTCVRCSRVLLHGWQ
jgi:phytoene dehydrogenase-like protein